jgi:hypothetical protein
VCVCISESGRNKIQLAGKKDSLRREKTLAKLASKFKKILANSKFPSHLASWRVVISTPECPYWRGGGCIYIICISQVSLYPVLGSIWTKCETVLRLQYRPRYMYGKVGQLGSNFKNSTSVHLHLLLLQHSLLQEVCKDRATILLYIWTKKTPNQGIFCLL